MIASALSLLLALPPVVSVDDRAEYLLVAAAMPGARCGEVKTAYAPRPTTPEALLPLLAPETKRAFPSTSTSTLPLLPTASLFGVEGRVVVLVAEAVQAKAGVAGPVVLDIDNRGARLRWQMPAGVRVNVDVDIDALVVRARADTARTDAALGGRAVRVARARSCFPDIAAFDDFDDVDVRAVRARFAVASAAPVVEAPAAPPRPTPQAKRR